MEPLGVMQTAHLFVGLHDHLMKLLRALTPEDWARSTLATPWTVRDVAVHILDGQVRRLSFQRDGFPPVPPDRPIESFEEQVAFLNSLNADWIRAARRMSPNVVVEFLEVTGPKVAALFESLDPHGPAFFPVAWAGESQSENWFDIGREYTEWWHHQAQIRDAVGAPPLNGRKWLHPVLELSMRAFGRGFKGLRAEPGTTLTFRVSGDAGGSWAVVAGRDGWWVYRGETPDPDATARCDEDTAWRLFFNALSEEETRRRIQTEGDSSLIDRLFSVRGVMV